MSTRGGNSKKTGQKYQNVKKYRNNMHDTSDRTKKINSLTIGGVCVRCKDIIDWKIAYKKYKPLKTPKKWFVVKNCRKDKRKKEVSCNLPCLLIVIINCVLDRYLLYIFYII